ncbi:MAG: CpaF family protein [Candidatus Nanopelagicales bacterium]
MNLAERLRESRAGRSATATIPDPRPGETIRPAGGTAPGPDIYADVRAKARSAIVRSLGTRLSDTTLSDDELRAMVTVELQTALATVEIPMSAEARAKLTAEIAQEVVGLGPLEPLLRDPTVTEIMTSGPYNVWVERDGRTERTDVKFDDEAHLRRILDRIVSRIGRRIDESSPKVDARLADGSRVHAIIAPLAVDGTALTIRKFSEDRFTIQDLVAFGTLSPASAHFLQRAVEARLSILVAGGTGSGKTTTLNMLSQFFPKHERIVTIEDLAELRLDHEHWIRLEGRPPNIEGKGEITLSTLVKESLRMRPDRVVVGEIRDGNAAMDMLQAMNTGHEGSMGTVHANSPRDCFTRIDGMVAIAGMKIDQKAVFAQVASAVDLIVFQARMRDGTRAVTHISEITGMEGSIISMQDVFVRPANAAGVSTPLEPAGLIPGCYQKILDADLDLDRRVFLTGNEVGSGGRWR